MKRRNCCGDWVCVVILFILSAYFANGLLAEKMVTLEFLGTPPGYYESSAAIITTDVSSDGSIIVGGLYEYNMISDDADDEYSIFIWENGVYTLLPEIGRCTPIITDDCAHIVAELGSGFRFGSKWSFTTGEGWVRSELPHWGENRFLIEAVSGDGSITVGSAYYGDTYIKEACCWKPGRTGTVLMGLGFSDLGERESNAYDVSSNGSVIVGADNTGGNQYIPVQWINYKVSILPKLPGYETEAHFARAVSDDGSLILGLVGDDNRPSKFMMWKNGHPEILFENTGQLRFLDISRDMKSMLLVSDTGSQYTTEMMDWQPIALNQFVDSYGINRQGFNLSATAISGDGSTVVGLASRDAGANYETSTFRLQILESGRANFGPFEVRVDGYCDTTPWLSWLWVENDPWVWSVDMNHWLYCPGENVTENGAWVYIPK
ncbi:hypothetical protein G0Q06_07310 [Puniceicoccales bacterium CK1056]|uniref:Uncharacterized protein n=1 Tax=Oceanipulchritudo coccoides TaxID=2706888 RepID=A0A6B2LZW4_9BACT|nr:hypothetical protein [Oceanipulchritudo coccoides]NDV62251.1 hypothetical protein [Oceanipulchritudo coccoides]